MTHLSRRTLIGGTLGLAGLTLTGAVRPSPASAAGVARPDIIGCDAWGAQPAKESISMVGPPTLIIVHHMFTPNVADLSVDAAHKIARSVQQAHMGGNDWNDTGQQFSISRGGFILEGRHRSIEGLDGGKGLFPKGSHSRTQNGNAIGIENEGTYTSELPPEQQWHSLVALCAYLCQTYGLTPDQVKGHLNFDNTACPGETLYAALPRLRGDIAVALGGNPGTPAPTPAAWPKVKAGATGFRVTAVQYLLREAGHDIPVSGTFDDPTAKATKAFQSAKKLTADAVIGAKTWEAPLAIKLRKDSRGEAVKALQTALNERGHKVGADGSFGGGTTAAVKAFQASASLPQDAVVGPDTWKALLTE